MKSPTQFAATQCVCVYKYIYICVFYMFRCVSIQVCPGPTSMCGSSNLVALMWSDLLTTSSLKKHFRPRWFETHLVKICLVFLMSVVYDSPTHCDWWRSGNIAQPKQPQSRQFSCHPAMVVTLAFSSSHLPTDMGRLAPSS